LFDFDCDDEYEYRFADYDGFPNNAFYPLLADCEMESLNAD